MRTFICLQLIIIIKILILYTIISSQRSYISSSNGSICIHNGSSSNNISSSSGSIRICTDNLTNNINETLATSHRQSIDTDVFLYRHQ